MEVQKTLSKKSNVGRKRHHIYLQVRLYIVTKALPLGWSSVPSTHIEQLTCNFHPQRIQCRLLASIELYSCTKTHIHIIKILVLKKAKTIVHVLGMQTRQNLLQCWQECKLVQSLWKSVCMLLSINLPYDPATLLDTSWRCLS